MTTLTKGQISVEDQKQYDGLNKTFTRDTSTGGTQTLTKPTSGTGAVDILAVYGGGTARTLATLTAALGSIGSNNAAILFTPGTWTITDDVTIPANIGIIPVVGAVLTVSAGKTLTINGDLWPYDAGYFAGSGTVDTSSATKLTLLANTTGNVTGNVTGDVTGAISGLSLGSLIQIDTYTSNSTWTKPAGCTKALVITVGGGGSGGGVSASSAAAGGGGAGAMTIRYITSGLGATEVVIIGQGGAPKIGAGNGNNGTASSFGSHTSADFGDGGSSGNASLTGLIDGAGGSGGSTAIGSHDLTIDGGYGQAGIITSNFIRQGHGGLCQYSNAVDNAESLYPLASNGLSGSNATGYGGGGQGAAQGSGTSAAQISGAGSDGFVQVWSYK